ncbi:MAG: hypothetical protein OIF58_11240 [Cohaesibacter sp.]|nr:hypothetical protein [Cohaesibacter sp.]
MSTIEAYRRIANQQLFAMKSFEKAWAIWLPQLHKLTDDFQDPLKVLKLGSELSSVFTSTASGRGQGDVSSAGASWEALVCWYLNVVLSGTNAVAIKQSRKWVPECVNDALTVNYSNTQTNTESDLVVLVFPDAFDFTSIVDRDVESFSNSVRSILTDIEVHVVQCKTNWNDNAQIPMLWDMVYKADGFKASNLTIGRAGVSIGDLRNFSYSFVTVPSQKESKRPKANSLSVKRVYNLSGGNYWGMETQSGVARALHEFFKNNLRSVFTGPVDHSIKRAIDGKIGWFAGGQ